MIMMYRSLSLCLYSYTPVSDESLSTANIVAITAVISSLVAFIAGTVCGALLTVCISRWNKKRDGFKPAPNIEEQPQAVPMVDRKNQEMIELEENVAYGPVKHDQKIELEENVAYGPVKHDQKIELEENVAYGPVKHDQKIEL